MIGEYTFYSGAQPIDAHLFKDDGNARFMCLDVMRFGKDGNILPIKMTTEWEYRDGKVNIIK